MATTTTVQVTENVWDVAIETVEGDVVTVVTAGDTLVEIADEAAQGAAGANGLSAYQIAVTNGFIGTEAQWLASLQGSSSGSKYIHTQTSESAEWIVNHNLGERPSVEVRNQAGEKVGARVLHTSLNQFIVYVTLPLAGEARCL
jgi:hypothetical protein